MQREGAGHGAAPGPQWVQGCADSGPERAAPSLLGAEFSWPGDTGGEAGTES